MEFESATAEAILSAARQAIIEVGTGRLTMSAVAAAAGVSRPTLYRWFPTKDELLVAISDYELEQFDIGLQAVIRAHRSPRRRLEATLRYVVSYQDDSQLPNSGGVDPGFALEYMARAHGPYVEILARLLGDALLEVPAVRAGTVTAEQAAELFLRVAYSHYLVPHPDPEALLASLLDLAGVSRRRVRMLAG